MGNWNNEMHKQVMQLTAAALDAADGAARENMMQLVIQRAVVYGHQECMRRLREQGTLVDPEAPPPGRTFAVTRHPDGTETVRRTLTDWERAEGRTMRAGQAGPLSVVELKVVK